MTTAYGVTRAVASRLYLLLQQRGVQACLPAEEYAEIRWDQLEAGDVNSLKIFTTVWRIVWVS